MTEIPDDVLSKTAKAMLDTIDQDEVYIGSDSDLSSVTIDGRVNVLALARIAILAERERCVKIARTEGGFLVIERLGKTIGTHIAEAIERGDQP